MEGSEGTFDDGLQTGQLRSGRARPRLELMETALFLYRPDRVARTMGGRRTRNYIPD